jgi:hypothetical protein
MGYMPATVHDTTQVVIPSVAYNTGALTSDFYAAVYSDSPMVNVTVTIPYENVMSFYGEPISITTRQSDQTQVYRIPFQSEILLVTTQIQCDSLQGNETDLVLFGAGGLQGIIVNATAPLYAGLNLNNPNYFYASNYTYDYYMLVMPNAPSLSLIVKPEPVRYLCNPVLLCNGHGSCNAERLEENCDCIQGVGFGYHGDLCEERRDEYAWIASVASFTIVLAFVISKIIMAFTDSKKNALPISFFVFIATQLTPLGTKTRFRV